MITRIKRVPVKHATHPKSESELSNNPTMDYTNYKLNDKVVKAITVSNSNMPFPADGMMSKPKGSRPTLPMRKRSNSDEDGLVEDSKPSSTMGGAAGGMNAGMMSALEGNTPLQRLYASQEAAAPTQLPGSPSSRMYPFILTGYEAAGGNMAGSARFAPQAFAPGSFMGRGANMPHAGPQMEDELVARQLAAMGRPADVMSAASASRSNDAALMARAMVMESERRRHHAMMQAQAQAAQAQAHAAQTAQAQAHAAQAAQAQAMGMGMPHANNMGNDTDILAAIQQRQRFLSRLETEFKAKMAARGGGAGM